jgi:hypothetical protein
MADFANNLMSCDNISDTHYQHDNFTDVILDTVTFGAGHTNINGQTWYDGNLYDADASSNNHTKQNGFADDQAAFFNIGNTVSGITVDANGNYYRIDRATDKLYQHDGFSSTVDVEFASPSTLPSGITTNGTDFFSCDYNTDLLYHHDGFSAVILDTKAAPYAVPFGITTDGTDFYVCDLGAAHKITKLDGFSTSILAEITSPDTGPTDVTWENWYARLGLTPFIGRFQIL